MSGNRAAGSPPEKARTLCSSDHVLGKAVCNSGTRSRMRKTDAGNTATLCNPALTTKLFWFPSVWFFYLLANPTLGRWDVTYCASPRNVYASTEAAQTKASGMGTRHRQWSSLGLQSRDAGFRNIHTDFSWEIHEGGSQLEQCGHGWPTSPRKQVLETRGIPQQKRQGQQPLRGELRRTGLEWRNGH